MSAVGGSGGSAAATGQPMATTGTGMVTVTMTDVVAPAPRVVEVILKEKKASEGTDAADGAAADKPPRIRWAEGTVDNEHLGRKSSKKCCIYHKPKVFGESSDESDFEDGDDHGHHDHHHGEDCPGHQHGVTPASGNIYSGGPR
eukprot:m.238678 g.238678  ORF g.238678 m.238678 type:complete len:144 (-) comp26238_c0_seq4:384-815(-)